MSAAADIVSRLQLLAMRRRALAWLLALLPWIALRSVIGIAAVVLVAGFDLWRVRRKVAAQWTAWLDAQWPEMEDSSRLLLDASTPVARLQQARVLRRAEELLGQGEAGRVAWQHIGHGFGWVVPSLVIAASLWAWQQRTVAAATPSAPIAMAAEKPAPTIGLRVEPPGYTGLASYDSAPRDLQVPSTSTVRWCVKNGVEPLAPVELSDGNVLRFERACAQWKATESVFWRWNGIRHNLRVTPDVAPVVTIAAPKDILTILPAGTTSAHINLAVQDDYRVVRATLHMTLARGSGENVRFSDREMPIPAGSNPKQRRFDRRFTLAELGMEPGDELYFFVRAVDNAGTPQMTQSPTYTLRLPGPQAEGEQSTALPMLVKPENLRSQRQIIIDTEQLLADMRANPRMPAAAIRARSEAIAGDQGVLRRRYGQFLGEESSLFAAGDDHAGEGEGGGMDVLHDYGHAHDQAENATLFDEETKKILRRALSAMWDAEKSLRAIEPRSALAPENKALLAIKELQQADRIYLHKTAFAPPPIKEEKRMTGELDGAASYQREQAGSDDVVPATVRKLIAALSEEGALPALWSRDANDWIRERIRDDDQRLSAQRAVQDVADGCVKCRPALRAWLRGAIETAPVLLQAKPVAETPFTKALQGGGRK
ncbi:hypothetical protein [Pseudoduganella sp. GCM10020061]|uniref:hypothetical protein n=1 Tax=Pseudoduganella sp. GCM10020061 TaxID=3317345 RepID=UPI003635E87E